MPAESYADIFDARGNAYHAAMQRCPGSRAAEFEATIAQAQLGRDCRIADIPSGGGYLQAFIPPELNSCVDRYETSQAFAKAGNARLCQWGHIPALDKYYDAVLSVAGLHHLSRGDLDAFYAESRRILQPGGRLVVAEVIPGSTQDEFLNVFVHRHNPMGHVGSFLKPVEEADSLRAAGFETIEVTPASYHWCFDSVESCLGFVRGLFGIEGVTDNRLTQVLESMLGLREGPGGVELPWALNILLSR